MMRTKTTTPEWQCVTQTHVMVGFVSLSLFCLSIACLWVVTVLFFPGPRPGPGIGVERGVSMASHCYYAMRVQIIE